MKSWLLLLVAVCLAISTKLPAAPISDLNSPLDNTGNDSIDLPGLEETDSSEGLDFLGSDSVSVPELKAATEAFRAGKVEDALRRFEAAEAAHPNLPPAKLMLARLYLQSKDRRRGRLLMEQVAAKHPHHPEVYLSFAKLALSEGRLADAMLHFQASISVKPPQRWPQGQLERLAESSLMGQVRVWERRGEWEIASRLLSKLVKLRPNDAELRDHYGADLFLAGQEDKAEEQFAVSFRIDGQMNRPEISMGVMFARRGDVSQSNQWFEKAIEKYPSEPKVHFEYSCALLYQDRAEESRRHGKRAAELGMDDPAIWMQRGTAARQAQRFAEAEEYFDRLLAQAPTNFDAMNQLALVLAEQNEPEKQRRAMQLALLNARQYPRNPHALGTLGWVHYRQGNSAEAARLLKTAANTNQASPETLFYLTQVLEAAGEPDPEIIAKLDRSLRASVERPGLFVLRPQIRQWLARKKPTPEGGEE